MSIKHGTRKVRFIRRNWDADFYSDLQNKAAFIITEPSEMTLDGLKRKSLYGPQSPLYGTSYDDDHSFAERYRCDCGAFVGRLFEGEICPFCNTPITAKGSDIKITGYISLGANKVINPYYFKILSNAIGKEILNDIIFAKYKITIDGQKERPKEEDCDIKPLSPFSGIGIEMFYNTFNDAIEYFCGVKKHKESTLRILLQQKDRVFCSHIPIPSTLLRPQSTTSDTLYFNTADKSINTLFTLSESVKNCLDVEKEYILGRIQTKLNTLWDIYFETLNGKEGIIRGEIMGGSLNFTSRNVIVPSPSLHDDEVDLSYHTFLELFKYRIIYYLIKIYDINLSKAHAMWKAASIFDERVYDIMEYIIQHEDVRVLINRNPTLNFYSMLLMHIRNVKKDGDDYSLSVPLSILPGLNADLTVIS